MKLSRPLPITASTRPFHAPLWMTILAIFALPLCAQGTTYFVKTPANGGSNANDGLSWATAKATVGAAMALIDGSDVINVAAGTYGEKISFPASDNNQLLGGYPAAGAGIRDPEANPTILNGTGLATSGPMISIPFKTVGFSQVSLSGIVIDGFTVRDGVNSPGGGTGAGIGSFSSGVTIRDCQILNNTGGSSSFAGGVHIFMPIGGGLDPVIERCVIKDNIGGAGGIALEGAGGASFPYKADIINCLIEGNQGTGSGTYGAGGVFVFYPGGANVVNTTITGNSVTGSSATKVNGIVVLGFPPSEFATLLLRNAIIWETAGDDLNIGPGGFLSGISFSNIHDADGGSANGTIHVDPKFVGPDDFHLQVTSPSVDTGTSGGANPPSPTVDLEGLSRPQGSGFDMGCYETLPPPPEPDLVVGKTVDQEPVTAGSLLTYTVAITNLGTLVAQGVAVTDCVPAQVTIDSVSDSNCVINSGCVECSFDDLEPGASTSFTISVNVPSNSPPGALTNIVTVAATNETKTANNTATLTSTVVGLADVTVSKDNGTASVVAGTAAGAYTIVVSNAGPSQINGGTVTDSVPPALLNAGWTCVAQFGATCGAAGSGDINDTVTLPPGGVVTYTLTGAVDSAATGVISNRVTFTFPAGIVHATTGMDTVYADDVDTVNLETDLSLTKSADVANAISGDIITYTLTVNNNGPSDAANVFLTDTLPPGVTFSISSPANAPSGGEVVFALGTLDAGDSDEILIAVEVDAGTSGQVENEAMVTFDQMDQNPADNTDTAQTDILVSGSARFDFDGDGIRDIGVVNPNSFVWTIRKSSGGTIKRQFGVAGATAVASDYDGDGVTDLAAYYPPLALWLVQQSTAGPQIFLFGLPGNRPVPGDYDGDGQTDLAVYDPATGLWLILRSQDGFQLSLFGLPGAKPVPADYDGDKKQDLGVHLTDASLWLQLQTTAGFTFKQFGPAGRIPAPCDFDGDGKDDLVVYDPPTGTWKIRQSTGGTRTENFGFSGTIPVPGDYDGDGLCDLAVFERATGTYYLFQSRDGFVVVEFGAPGLVPIGAP